MSVPYSHLLARVERSSGAAAVDVPGDWMQGRSVYGGLQAAIGVAAMRTLVPEAPLRALQVSFLAPVPEGRVQGRAEILRAGKNVTTVEARLAGETLQAIAVGTFGVARASEVSAVPVQPPISGDRSIELPFIPGVVPAFLEHFAARWRAGSPPFTRVTERDHVVEVDMRDEGPTTEAHVLAIADFMPPLALAQLSRPVPGSTATWMLELFADRFDELALSGWRLDATLRSARDGYISQSVMLWGPDGVPVGIGHQSMLVFG